VGRQRRKIAWWSLAVVLVVGLIVPARGGVAAATKASRVPQQLVGCWKRHVGALPVGTPPGFWQIEISKAGRLDAYTPGTRCGPAAGDFTASVSAVAKRLTIGSVPVCATRGVYSWKVSGNSLTLRALADRACSARVGLFVGIWKKT
jgi:hypothetical protein